MYTHSTNAVSLLQYYDSELQSITVGESEAYFTYWLGYRYGPNSSVMETEITCDSTVAYCVPSTFSNTVTVYEPLEATRGNTSYPPCRSKVYVPLSGPDI